MTFQKLVTYFVVVSLATTSLAVRFGQWPLLSIKAPITFLLLLLGQFLLAVLYNIFVQPRISSLRHLPCAPQKHPFKRLLKEPCPWHFEQWTSTVKNDGLIRYYGVLNIERVLVTSPDAVKSILQTQVYSFQKQYHQRSYFEKNQGYGLVIQEGNYHRHARKYVGHALGQKRVSTDYWPAIQEKATQLLQVLSQSAMQSRMNRTSPELHSPSGSELGLDIGELLLRTIFDVSGIVSYGIDFDSVLHPEARFATFKEYNEIFEGSTAVRERLILGFVLPKWLVDVLPIHYNGIAARGMQHFKKFGKTFMKGSPPAVAKDRPFQSVMDELIVGGHMDDAELWEQYLMMLPGALHNTLSGMLSAMWFLSQPKYAHIQTKLREELQRDFEDQDDSQVKLSSFERYAYLKAVINEVLRVHPPASWFGREVATTTEVSGTTLPKGLLIGFSPWAYHRDTSLWGPDAAEFKPDRWLTDDKPMTTTSENQAWLTFGAGPRRCVGEALAKAELYCVLARVFKRFEMKMADPEKVARISHHITTAYRDPVRVVLTDLMAK